MNIQLTPSSMKLQPLDEDMMRRSAPSIFATEAHDSRSERYTYIPTFHVVRALMREGFQPMSVRQSRTRDASRKDFTKHMIRFRRPDNALHQVGDTVPEIALVNSHDGTSAYIIMAGLFRLVCLNGLVVCAGELDTVRVPHKGDVTKDVIDGSFRVLEQSTKALEAPDKWSRVLLNGEERNAFAESARVLRFGDAEGNVKTPIQAPALLKPRRRDDTHNDLWTTFNRVQENVIRGGLTAIGRDANNRMRRSTSREVRGIDQDVKLNRALWTLAAKMAELKAA
jgi:hypothetical protein